PVGLALHALADPPGPLGVRHGALVEAVDLHLESMEAEILEQVTLELACRLVAELLPAEVRVDRETATLGDLAGATGAVEPQSPGRRPVDLDDELPGLPRLLLRALDRGDDPLAVLRADRREVRLDVLVGEKVDQEVGVLERRAAELHVSIAAVADRPPDA